MGKKEKEKVKTFFNGVHVMNKKKKIPNNKYI
jgi:glycyl-tRNA synthetase beta subunit